MWDSAEPAALADDGVALLTAHLSRAGLDPMRRTALKDAALPYVLTTMKCEAAADAVSAVLDRAGVRHAILKGPGLSLAWQSLFGADLRTYTDIDVLVSERDLPTVERLLIDHLDASLGSRSSGELTAALPSGATVDVHWNLLNDKAAATRHPFDTDDLLSRRDLSGRLPLLDPVDALLHTCLHAVISNASKLSAAFDVASLIKLHHYDASEVLVAAQVHHATLPVAVMLDRAAAVTRQPSARDLASQFPDSLWRSLCRRGVASLEPASGRRWSGAELVRLTRTGTADSLAAVVAGAPTNIRTQRALRRPQAVDDHTGSRVALISLEPWDQVWRRNQHLVSELVSQRLVASVVFVEPPQLHRGSAVSSPLPGVTVVRPPLPTLRRIGGLHLSAAWLRRRWLHDVDLLWVNDPVLGLLCLDPGRPTVYDVTDDWRHAPRPQRLTAGIVAAEDRLAREATTIVCSAELARRWKDRYDVDAAIVQNAATRASYSDEQHPIELSGPGPHIAYVGTLHQDRLDIDLCLELAASSAVGTLHLVGPDATSPEVRHRLDAASGIVLHGPVPSDDVPRWLMSFDALICPHVVTPFTMSLDAIKAFEYLATDRPVIATPTSGFQDLTMSGLSVVDRTGFVAKVADAVVTGTRYQRSVGSWSIRAPQFAAALPVQLPVPQAATTR